jgi:rRNA-processing protein FCF1
MLMEEAAFARHVGKSILLDSNLLLVLLAGRFDPRLFGRFDRISKYSYDDYELLERLVGRFSILFTTPHILTEVGNLANKLSEQWRDDWLRNTAVFVACLDCKPVLDELWTPAKQLVLTQEFLAFGLADASLAQFSDRALIVTDDYRLSGVLRRKGVPILNFHDLRKVQQN